MAVAMSVNYYTVNGMILAEDRGGAYSEFVPDTLGSCVAVKDASETITYTADYWPYGEVRTSTGSKSSPWGFVGLLGYLTDLAKRLYVRARHYRPSVGQWQTVDPLWPKKASYKYADSSPNTRIDFTGAFPIELAAALLGCLVGASISIWDVLRGGGGLGEALCKGAVSCITGALTGFLLSLAPNAAVGCLAGAVGSLVSSLLGKLCEPPPLCPRKYEPTCALIGAGVGAVLGCFGSGGGGGNGVADFIIGFIVSIFGVACENTLGTIAPK